MITAAFYLQWDPEGGTQRAGRWGQVEHAVGALAWAPVVEHRTRVADSRPGHGTDGHRSSNPMGHALAPMGNREWGPGPPCLGPHPTFHSQPRPLPGEGTPSFSPSRPCVPSVHLYWCQILSGRGVPKPGAIFCKLWDQMDLSSKLCWAIFELCALGLSSSCLESQVPNF